MEMTLGSRSLKIMIIIALGCVPLQRVNAQASPTAIQRLHISTFAGATGTYTGLASGRNLGITAGVDIGFRSFLSLQPYIELRGTYAIDKGEVDSQKNVISGLKLAKAYGRFHPYGDVLFGRGQINYRNGFPDPRQEFAYFQSFSNVLSLGGGVDISLSDHFQLKADGQFQRYSSPVTESGHQYLKPVTLGIVYRFTSTRLLTKK